MDYYTYWVMYTTTDGRQKDMKDAGEAEQLKQTHLMMAV